MVNQQVVNQQLGASRAVAFPSDRVRSLFPALNQKPAIFCTRTVQRGGRYTRSMEPDDDIACARESAGVLINARHRNDIAFGMKATAENRGERVHRLWCTLGDSGGNFAAVRAAIRQVFV